MIGICNCFILQYKSTTNKTYFLDGKAIWNFHIVYNSLNFNHSCTAFCERGERRNYWFYLTTEKIFCRSLLIFMYKGYCSWDNTFASFLDIVLCSRVTNSKYQEEEIAKIGKFVLSIGRSVYSCNLINGTAHSVVRRTSTCTNSDLCPKGLVNFQASTAYLSENSISTSPNVFRSKSSLILEHPNFLNFWHNANWS